MPGNQQEMITSAERRLPVRIRIAVPPKGLRHGTRKITGSLDENCGADGWAMTLSGTRGVLNDALFSPMHLASAFATRWGLSCEGQDDWRHV